MSIGDQTANGDLFHQIGIVLVEPTHPGNIGAAARAMKAMGLDRLILVAPKRFPSMQATARAAGADDILHAARIVESLDDALADYGFVLGTTARSRRIAWPALDARGGAHRVVMQAAQAPVAVIFGRENSGLTNAELDRCHALVRIPTAAHFSSLNIAAAVQIIAYEIRATLEGGMTGVTPPTERIATAGELAGFYRHLEAMLIDIGYLDPAVPKLLMRRLRRLFNRAELDASEINILRGILTAVMNHSVRAIDHSQPSHDVTDAASG